MSNPADPNRSTRLYRAATPVEEEDIHPGAVIGGGRFKIFGIIGRGKMASVFRARDLRRNSDIALKVLARKFVGHHDRERRFDNEARLAGRLQGHRNVVAPIESGRLDDCGGRMFLAMELVNGPTLTDLVAMNGPLRVEDACMYMRDVARALRDLHQSGVVHRDVKSENVIVVEIDGERVAKLLDFGFAADTGAGPDARMTRLGERPGTPLYMSPEQAWDAPAHPVFDIYALGVTFYEILTGHPPFFELDEAEVINRKCDINRPAPSVQGKRDDLPPRLDTLIDACLEPVAKKRMPSINSFLKRLDAITESFGGAMAARTRQQTSMVGQARTISPTKKKKSRLPELMAQAAARKQAAFVYSAPISPEAPTPDPDRVMSTPLRSHPQPAVGSHPGVPLGGQPGGQPGVPQPGAQPGVPQPGARSGTPRPAVIINQPQPAQPAPSAHRGGQSHVGSAQPYGGPPRGAAHSAYPHVQPGPAGVHPGVAQVHPGTAGVVPGAQPPVGVAGAAGSGHPHSGSRRSSSDSGLSHRSLRHARPAPVRVRPIATNRAIVIGLVVGAVLSTLLVVGLWMWLMGRRGG
ncbi:MAG: protein kinase [Myxococcota bacterium]